jgi:hypothetical protein
MAQGYAYPQQQQQQQQHMPQQPLANGRPVFALQPAPPPLPQQQPHQLRHPAAPQRPPPPQHQVQAGGIAAYVSHNMLHSFVLKRMAYTVSTSFSDAAFAMLQVPFQQQQSWQQQELLQQSQQPKQVLHDSMFHHRASQLV